MTRKERLAATLRGEPVDRSPVSFYELDAVTRDPGNPFNIYNDPSWKPLLDMVRDRVDRIVSTRVPFQNTVPGPLSELTSSETWEDEHGSRFTRRTIRAPGRTLTSLSRRDRDINTNWHLEHLLKNEDDFRAWLELPEDELSGEPDVTAVLRSEKAIGETGIPMFNTGDPICAVAGLFDMGEFTVIALTQQELMHRALQRQSRRILARVETVAKALPGRLWRIFGPEYAAPPYLPPRLFEEYVTRYDTPLVEAIQRHGGYARIHSHGRLKDILDHIAATGCAGLDPIEPPPQGDVELGYVRRTYGKDWVLFGNLEVSDIETLEPDLFAGKVRTALREGTEGMGRGFVLMASASPYGCTLAEKTIRNYETMVELAEAYV